MTESAAAMNSAQTTIATKKVLKKSECSFTFVIILKMMTNFSKKGKHFFEKFAKNQRFFKVFCKYQPFFADVANIALVQK